jgi:hypothetical protein
MSQEIRRLHRRKTDFTNFSSSESPSLPNPTESTASSIQQDSDDAPSPQPLIANSYSTDSTNDINTIRTELLEDLYHANLAESDYSDDTHDWGWDSQTLSDDYWHFLGKYE